MIAVSEDVLIRRETVSGPLSRLFSRGEGAEQTRKMLERADLPLLPHEFFTMKLIIAAVMIGVGYIAAGYAGGSVIQAIGAAGGGVIGYIAPGWYAKRRISQRAALIEDQLVEMLELMSSSMQAGFGYMQALVATAQQLDPPPPTPEAIGEAMFEEQWVAYSSTISPLLPPLLRASRTPSMCIARSTALHMS